MPPRHRHRILVTGGTGFVGGHLLARLQNEDGCEVIAPGQGSMPALDIRDRHSVDALVREVRPSAVIHLAAIAAPAEARDAPARAWEVNLTGTRHLAEAVLAHAPEARFVHAGSSDSYGTSFLEATAPLTEDAALNPTNTYAATKAAADILIGQMAHAGLRAMRFRPFNHTGPGQSDSYVIASFAQQVARVAAGVQHPVVKVGNIDIERDFLDVRDVVAAYRLAAFSDVAHRPDHVFNLSSGRPCSIRDILSRLIQLSGAAMEIVVDPARVRPADVARTWGDASRAMSVLGWAPEISFEQTLEDVLQDWRDRL